MQTHSPSAAQLEGKDITFTIFGRTVAAKRWGSAGGKPTLALHGWLDNANTYDRLAPYLPELDLVALDFAGHGLSAHRGEGVHYLAFAHLQDVLAVAQELGWSQFNLIGHSMGAAIASELAGLFPDKIERAVMIDGFLATGPLTAQERLEQQRAALESMVQGNRGVPKVFADTQAMAQRVTEATDQSLAAAEILVARGHRVVDGGVSWRTDARIRLPSPLRHTRETIDLIVRNSTSPALLVVAEQGDEWYQGEIDATAAQHPNLTIERLPGPHHIHLEAHTVEAVAGLIRPFLGLRAGVQAA